MGAIEELEEYAEARQISFAEALQRYQVVGANYDPAHGSFMIMSERDPGMSGDIAIAELGYSSPSPWTSWIRDERVPELRDKAGLRTYYDMKRSDGTIRGALRLLKTPILAARWFVEPASDSVIDKNIAEFVERNLFHELNLPWSRIVEDALLMCDFGYFPFELVFKIDGDKLKLQKLAPRHPMDVKEWQWDEHGGPRGIVMEQPYGQYSTSYGTSVFQGVAFDGSVSIPIEKLVIFVLEQEGGDLRGTSILRSCYKHHYYKDTLYKIDCVDEETEIFTKKGWKHYDKIEIGDETLTINTSTGLSEWNEIEAIHKANGTHNMIKMESRVFSAMTTPDHRWFVKNKRSGDWVWKTTETLSYLDQVPKSAEVSSFPTEQKYTDTFVELVAWMWADGTNHNGMIYIEQSNLVNEKKVQQVRNSLSSISPVSKLTRKDRFGTKWWTENINDSRPDITQFRLSRLLSLEFAEAFIGYKVVDPDFILRLTKAQLNLFVQTCISGDGYRPTAGHEPYIAQEIKERLFSIELACALLGIPTSIRYYDYGSISTGGPHWRLQLLRKHTYSPKYAENQSKRLGYANGMTITKEQYQGTVWCVSTSNGNWLARRKGSVYYTGNSIQKERHGIGVPMIKLPPGYSTKDKNTAEDLGRNLRTNERAHIVAPSTWEILFAKLEGQPVNCIPSIEHHDMKIKSNILAPFMDEANVNPDSLDVYYKSTRYIATTVCDTFNHFVIPKLVDFNFSRGGYPKLRVRRIGEQEDIRTMSFAFRNFVGAGAIRPDDELEDFLRSELDLPPVDKTSVRMPATQQQGQTNTPGTPMPPKVGLPKQAPKVNVKLPQSNAGLDTSGGK